MEVISTVHNIVDLETSAVHTTGIMSTGTISNLIPSTTQISTIKSVTQSNELLSTATSQALSTRPSNRKYKKLLV